jgi:hypothetical protein
MPETDAKKISLPKPDPCFPPYYPDEDRQLAAELMELAGKLMDIAGRVIKPDHYWYKPPEEPPTEPILPLAKDKK